MVIIVFFEHGPYCLLSLNLVMIVILIIVIMITLLWQSVGYDDGRGILKCSLNRTKKGETAMKVKRGKEQPINEDRGSKHAQVWFKVGSMATKCTWIRLD